MKTTLLILSLALSAIGQGVTIQCSGPVPPTQPPPAGSQQLAFANTNGTIAAALPTQITNADFSVIINPDSNTLVSAGWRWVQGADASTNGYGRGQYSVTDLGGGWCYLSASNTLNLVVSADAVFTNSPLWTAGLIANLQTFRSLIRAYQGAGAETNAQVNPQTTLQYLATAPAFAAVSSNIVNSLSLVLIGQEFMTDFPQVPNTAKIPWRLVP